MAPLPVCWSSTCSGSLLRRIQGAEGGTATIALQFSHYPHIVWGSMSQDSARALGTNAFADLAFVVWEVARNYRDLELAEDGFFGLAF
jgi:hypothetical protein